MDARTFNHRQCNFRGEGIRHLVREIAQRTSWEQVDDAIAGMNAQRTKPTNDFDAVAHQSRQYVACGGCGKPITVDDINFNQCAHCGAQILSK